jgi:large subunit ribosomal protein L32
MALQKRRLSRSRIHHRRSSWMASFKKKAAAICPSCASPKLPHRVCMNCGFFRKDLTVEGIARPEGEE